MLRAVAFGSRLLPTRPVKDFHLQSSAHAGHTNSGILATGAKPGAFDNYDPAPPDIIAKVDAIEEVCTRHGVRLIEAALRFPLLHPSVVSTIPGAQSVDQAAGNAEIIEADIPNALWSDLKSKGLVREDAPTP